MSSFNNYFYHAFKRFGKRTVLALGSMSSVSDPDALAQPFTSPNYRPELYFAIKDLCDGLESDLCVNLDDVFRLLHKNCFYKPRALIRYELTLENKVRNILLNNLVDIFEIFERQILTRNDCFISKLPLLIKPLNEAYDSDPTHKYSLARCFSDEVFFRFINIINTLNHISNIESLDEADRDLLIQNLKLLKDNLLLGIADENESSPINFTLHLINMWKCFNIPLLSALLDGVNQEVLSFIDEHPFILSFEANKNDRNLVPVNSAKKADCYMILTKKFFTDEYDSLNQILNDRPELIRKKILKRQSKCEKIYFGDLFNFYFLDATRHINPYCNVDKVPMDKVKSILLNPRIIHQELMISADSKTNAINSAWSNANDKIINLSNDEIEKLWQIA